MRTPRLVGAELGAEDGLMEHHIDAVVPVRPVAMLDQRVGDLERSATCDELAGHFAAGRLTGDELNQRLEAAVSARTTRDLRLVLADLPSASRPGQPPSPRPAPVGPRTAWSAFDGAVLVALLGAVMVVGVMMLALAASGEVAMFLCAAVGGSLAALAGACLVQLGYRSRRAPGGRG